MARTSEKQQRLKIQTDFFRWFDGLTTERQQAVIDSLEISMVLAAERRAKRGPVEVEREPAEQTELLGESA